MFIPLCSVWFLKSYRSSRPLTSRQAPLHPALLLGFFHDTPRHIYYQWDIWVVTSAHACVCVCLYVLLCVMLYGSETERRNPNCFSETAYLPKPIICGKRSTASCLSISLSPWQPLLRWTASWDSRPLLAALHRAAVHSTATGCMWLDWSAVHHTAQRQTSTDLRDEFSFKRVNID